MIKEFWADHLAVKLYSTRKAMGQSGGEEAIFHIQKILNTQPYCNIIFAAAPSQKEFLQELLATKNIDWTRVNAFHMDEYIGLPSGSPQSFSHFLKEALFNHLPFNNIFYIKGDVPDIQAECNRYSRLLIEHPPDVCCMGIGENGHIAFNDPPVADFNDPFSVKEVTLDYPCRLQQVHDGCFTDISFVPKTAITLTISALLQAKKIFCVVPGPTKAAAIKAMLEGPVEPSCPASILRTHHNAALYIDKDSASLLSNPTSPTAESF